MIINIESGILSNKKYQNKNIKNISITINDNYIHRSENMSLIIDELSIFLNKKGYGVYLIVGDNKYINKNRISSYYKLWKRLIHDGFDINLEHCSSEYSIENNDKIKYFGAIKIDRSNINIVIKLQRYFPYSYLIIIPNNISIDTILEYGFIFNPLDDDHYVNNIYNLHGFIFVQDGEFDDMYTGIFGAGEIGSVRGITKYFMKK